MWLNEHFERHFSHLSPECIMHGHISMTTYCDKLSLKYVHALCIPEIPGPRDNDEIVKVTATKVKVTDNIFRKCTFLAEAY